MHAHKYLIFVIVVAGVCTAPAAGQLLPCEIQQVFASDAPSIVEFGASMSLSDDGAGGLVAIVGVPKANDNGGFSGAAFVFRYDGVAWVEQQKLIASDGDSGDELGWSVAISCQSPNDCVAVAGAVDDEGPAGVFGAGSAYVFRFDAIASEWIEEQKLASTDPMLHDRFGHAVAVSGDIVVVGAPRDDTGATNAGAVYVYRHDGDEWVEEQFIVASDAHFNERFGASVGINGDTVLVGAERAVFETGAVYVLRHRSPGPTWEEEQILMGSTTSEGDVFGRTLASDGDVLVVGAPRTSDPYPLAGAAFVFEHDGEVWAETGALNVQNPEPIGSLGTSVAVHGDSVVVGVTSGAVVGAAYEYQRADDGWILLRQIASAGGSVGDSFGTAVATTGDHLLVTAPGDDDGCTPGQQCDAGAMYFFNLAGPDSDDDAVQDDCDNCPLIANADQADCDQDGVGDACVNDSDGDAVPDDCDNCPLIANADQADCGQDGVGDACADDSDGDAFPDDCDNCPEDFNPDQDDFDGDGLGNACDADIDGDDVDNSSDNCPLVVNTDQTDTDDDGVGDVCDSEPAILHFGAGAGGTTPCSGYIDPARESTNGVEFNVGIQEVFLKFNVEVFQSDGVSDVDGRNFTIVETGDDSPPAVTAVEYVDSDRTYVRVAWDRPITLREWTTIIAVVYNADGFPIPSAGNTGSVNEPDRVDIGFLPIDVNQSGDTGPLDLLAFKQLVNLDVFPAAGCSSVKADYADINRSGVVNPLDALAFKQLVHGINPATQSWAFETMNNPRP